MTQRDDQKNQVQQATDIIQLIGEQVALKPRGKEFLGLCPFHDDKSPSMHVSPAKQIYKCFACGAGGDVFSFMMNYHKMSFPEALKTLAERAGIKLVWEGARGRGAEGAGDQGPTERERIADANAKAVSFYRALYRHAEHGQIARAYVEKRRISPEMVEAFQLGYAPDRWDGLALMIGEKNWDSRAFELAGLIASRDRGAAVSDSANQKSFYDRLRHRLVFPIFDALGRPIAFGGRKIRDEDEPKYLNSPETPLFNKSATLYGLHLAKKPIIDSKTAVIVEGYTDVIACHQAGVRNVVATLGTALTIQHVQALRHFCDKVVLVYDGDEAGQKAADRAVEVFLTGGLDVFIAVIPDDLDPADMFELADGLERWAKVIEGAVDALEFQFRRVHANFENESSMAGRQRIAEDYLRRLAAGGLEQAGAVRKSMITQRVAQLLHLPEATVVDLIKRLTPSSPRPRAGDAPTGTRNRPGGFGEAGSMPGNSAATVAAGGSGGMDMGSAETDAAGEVADNASGVFADGVSANRIRAVEQAERLIVGCLLREASLFHQVLADGRAFDEALTPGDFVTASGRRLYERVYFLLADGETLTLSSLLADLASQSEQDLSDLATRAESEVDMQTQGKPDSLKPLFLSAAASITNLQREKDYERAKRSLAQPGPDADGTEKARLAAQLAAVRRANPSPVRIARIQP